MKKSILFVISCCLVVCLCTPSVSAQKKQFYGVLPKKEAGKDVNVLQKTDDLENPQKDKKEAEMHLPWLQKPYLQKESGKATVQEMIIAAQLWREKNIPDHVKLKDDEFVKFQRKLYQWEREGSEQESPTTANERMDAFTEYAQNAAVQSATNNFNVDANWKLLGPINNPDDTPYKVEGFDDEDKGNAALGRINCIEFSVWDANNMWVGTAGGGVWKSWDGGKNWWNISMTLPIMEISDIAVDQSNSNIIYVATGDRDGQGGWYGNGSVASRLYKTTDGGDTWKQIVANFGTGTFIEGLYIHPQKTDEIVVMKTSGSYKSKDGGVTWTKTFNINGQNEFFVANISAEKANPNRLFAMTVQTYPNDGFSLWLSRSDDFGNTWNRTDSIKSIINSPDFLGTNLKMCVAPSDPNCIYIAALEYDTVFRAERFGALVRSLDGGNTWQDRSRFPSVPNILGWVLGDSMDIGSQGTYNLVVAVDPKNRERVFVSGVDMWGSENGGETFSKTTFWVDVLGKSAHADHHWGEFSPVSGEFFLATDGGLYKTKNLAPSNQKLLLSCYNYDSWNYFNTDCYEFPTTWEYAGNGIANNEFYAIEVSKSNPDMVIGGTQDNGTFLYKNGKWTSIFGGDGFVPLINPQNPNNFYASVYFGQMWRTTDGGKNYQYITSTMDMQDGGAWLTPMAIVEASPNTLIQGRERNVWRSTNSGTTWQRISNFTPGLIFNRTSALEVAPSNGNIIWVAKRTLDSSRAVTKRFLYKTTNGGTTWTNVWNAAFPPSTLTDIAIHPTNPNKVWVTFAVGYVATNVNQSKKVFYSNDGGVTWTNINDGLPPVPVWTIAVSAESFDDGVYVGTGVGVFYRDSRTGKFIEYQNPQMPKGTIVTDLKIHAGTRRIYAGTHGHGIWRADLYDNPLYVNALSKKVDKTAFLSVYPNPSKGLVKVVWDNEKIPVESLKVIDFTGREIFIDTEFKGKSVVDMTQYPAGAYMIQLKTDSEIIAKKVVIEK